MLKKIAVCLSLLAGFVSVAIFSGWWLLSRPATLNKEVNFIVHSGESMGSIVHRLGEIEFFQYPQLLQFYSKITGLDRSVQAGEYRILPHTSALGLLEKFVSGDVILYYITLVEGRTFRNNLAALDNVKLKNEIKGLSSAQIMAKLGVPQVNPEGMFFPDTYFFRSGETALSILKRSYKRMQETLDDEWSLRAKNLPYKNPYEALVMASLIERETGVSEERPAIAGVFVKRMKKNMRLQTDPAVIYGLGDKFQGKLSRELLRTPTPYNTYLNRGLPPTPISLVGRAALRAALQPEDNDYLYFVARGDGYHFFSATLSEHNAAVKQYQLSRRPDYRSVPAK